jgi:hypothetical protein
MPNFVIIPCGAAKGDRRSAAKDLYLSSNFALTLTAALAVDDDVTVLILSALHGLLALDDEVDPYDVKMGDAGCITPTGVMCSARFAQLMNSDAVITTMLPAAYNACLVSALAMVGKSVAHVAYADAPGIGYQRGVAGHVIAHRFA